MTQITTKSIIKIKTIPDSDIIKISFSNSDSPFIIISLSIPGGYSETSVVNISDTVEVGMISQEVEVVVVVVDVTVVEVLDVSGMKSVWIFIFSNFNSFGLIRPRGSMMKVPESRVSSKKSSVEPT